MDKLNSIDLNCDMGEAETMSHNHDGDIMPYISSCNVSCGFHSGNPQIIERTISLALQHNVSIGAHPSYNDRGNFGRKVLDTPIDVLRTELIYQISAIKTMTESLGGKLHHVKAHGALYNVMNTNKDIAETFVEVVKTIDPNLITYTMAGSQVIDICKMHGISYAKEVFVDRNYSDKVSLVSRSQPNALLSTIPDIKNRLDDIIACKITDIKLQQHKIIADTVCLHSDTPDSINIAKAIHHHLNTLGIAISSDR